MENFSYNPAELSAFSLCIDTFIISLTNGQVVHYEPTDTSAFLDWLLTNRVRNISPSKG